MAGHIIHNQSYSDIYQKLPMKMQEEFESSWDSYNIFAQGHDLFFPYMFLHFYKLPTLIKQLKVIQDEGIQKLTINYINGLQEVGATHEAKLFLYGYLLHHFLDAKLHPLVIYETGNFINDKQAEALHLKVENMIDAYQLKKQGIDPRTFKIHSTVKSNMALTSRTKQLVDASFLKTYGYVNLGKVFEKYNANTKKYLYLLRYDPQGLKTLLFTPFDYVMSNIFKPGVFPFHYDGTEAIDYLNLENKPWIHPIDSDSISTKSFDELYTEGVEAIAKMISMLNEAIIDQATNEQISGIIPNISSHTGVLPKQLIKNFK